MSRSITLFFVALSALGCGSDAAATSASAAASGSAASGSGASGSAASNGAASSDGLKVGDAAPAVSMTLQDGKKVELASLKDKLVLVYFYPKDDTPGCTVEAQGVRDSWKDFQAAGIDVYGVSTQDAASHQAFIEKHELPFPLVVDEGGAIATAFKVPLRNGNALRQSFLIGKDGTIKAVWPAVDPAEHAKAVLAAARS